jgi:ABC-type phosphate transport system permease subunit
MAITSAGETRPTAASLRNRFKPGDWLFIALTAGAVLALIAIIAGLFWELSAESWSSIQHTGLSFIWNTTWDPSHDVYGAGAFVVGTLITSVFALVLATVVAVLVALFLVEVAPGWVSRPVSYLIELLAAIPSVVYGLWGIFVMGAAILGLARAVGETLAVTLVIGNSVKIPDNVFAPAYTMASVIANQFNEATGIQRSALLEVALLLLIITVIINIVARLLVWKVTNGKRVVVQE